MPANVALSEAVATGAVRTMLPPPPPPPAPPPTVKLAPPIHGQNGKRNPGMRYPGSITTIGEAVELVEIAPLQAVVASSSMYTTIFPGDTVRLTLLRRMRNALRTVRPPESVPV